MPVKRDPISLAHIEDVADCLRVCAEHLATVSVRMNEAGLKDLWMVWNRKHDDAIDFISGLGTQALAEIDDAIRRHKRGLPNRHAVGREKSRRDYEVSQSRKADTPKAPTKKRGRPRKSS